MFFSETTCGLWGVKWLTRLFKRDTNKSHLWLICAVIFSILHKTSFLFHLTRQCRWNFQMHQCVIIYNYNKKCKYFKIRLLYYFFDILSWGHISVKHTDFQYPVSVSVCIHCVWKGEDEIMTTTFLLRSSLSLCHIHFNKQRASNPPPPTHTGTEMALFKDKIAHAHRIRSIKMYVINTHNLSCFFPRTHTHHSHHFASSQK